MTDSVKVIREAVNARIEAITSFTKLDNKFDLEKNNFTNQNSRYGVIALDGSRSDSSLLRFMTIDRTFEVTLCNRFIPRLNKDSEQEAVGDILENTMESIIDDLESSKVGLPNLVLTINFASNDSVVYDEIESLAILRFNVVVQYRKQIINC